MRLTSEQIAELEALGRQAQTLPGAADIDYSDIAFMGNGLLTLLSERGELLARLEKAQRDALLAEIESLRESEGG